MIFGKTSIEGLYIIEPEITEDERGYFTRIFAREELEREGLSFAIVHANVSFTKKRGTIRGLHFQKEPGVEGKIVHCVKGAIYDVAVDLRKDSNTFGKWVAEELTEENNKMFFIPRGFAHGLQTLTDHCIVHYKMDNYYISENADSIKWNDPDLGITWPIEKPVVISERDAKAQSFMAAYNKSQTSQQTHQEPQVPNVAGAETQ